MRKLFLFMMISLDGFFEGDDHDISWHHVDAEFNDFAIAQLNEVDTLLFGRKTYELMASYWPTESAQQDDPVVAKLMNTTPKIVFSQTVNTVDWENTTLVKGDAAAEVARLKQEAGKDLAIFGSSHLSVSLLEKGLLDELRIMVNPVIVGKGTRLFDGLSGKLSLQLQTSKTFANGNVLLAYQPLRP